MCAQPHTLIAFWADTGKVKCGQDKTYCCTHACGSSICDWAVFFQADTRISVPDLNLTIIVGEGVL